MATIEQKNARRDEILKILGAVASKSNLESLIKTKQQLIKNNEQTILSLQHNIGTLFIKHIHISSLLKPQASQALF